MQSDQNMSDNPMVGLVQLAMGLWVSRAIWAAAHLKVADAVGDGPADLAAIADATGTKPEYLRRLMNALVAANVFRADGADRFAPGEMSPFLRSDHPVSQRAFIDAVFGGEHYASWGALAESLRTGQTAFDSVYGEPVFDWYGRHPQEAQLFSRAMEGTTRVLETVLLACWSPPAFELGVDVGGSRGTLLAGLLDRDPAARGILFDLPEIADSVRDSLPNPRMEALGGDFFQSVPEGDLYLLKLILHDWTDERSEAILRSIRAAVRPGGRVAIIETLLPERAASGGGGYLMDVNMMVMTGGRERTAEEYGAMLERTGWKTESVTPTPLDIGVVQAIAA